MRTLIDKIMYMSCHPRDHFVYSPAQWEMALYLSLSGRIYKIIPANPSYGGLSHHWKANHIKEKDVVGIRKIPCHVWRIYCWRRNLSRFALWMMAKWLKAWIAVLLVEKKYSVQETYDSSHEINWFSCYFMVMRAITFCIRNLTISAKEGM